jgi:type IV pilus assembly protein PilZ
LDVSCSSDIPPEDRPSDVDKDRRSYDRIDVVWNVDCQTEDTFLYARITNISEMGIFIKTMEPLPLGTRLQLSFEPAGLGAFVLEGQVQWINPWRPLGENLNPGMGILFINLTIDERERIVDAIHTIAYVRDRSS